MPHTKTPTLPARQTTMQPFLSLSPSVKSKRLRTHPDESIWRRAAGSMLGRTDLGSLPYSLTCTSESSSSSRRPEQVKQSVIITVVIIHRAAEKYNDNDNIPCRHREWWKCANSTPAFFSSGKRVPLPRVFVNTCHAYHDVVVFQMPLSIVKNEQ